MKYSNFINKNTNPSRLGFGLMRLPIIENDNGQINYKESRNLVEKSLELGINYFDTAYVYHERQSEIFAGEIFKDIRDKVYLATKLPVWKVEKPGDFEYILDAELTKMQTDYIDFYLLHALHVSFHVLIVLQISFLHVFYVYLLCVVDVSLLSILFLLLI